jgi:hypothetical protein
MQLPQETSRAAEFLREIFERGRPLSCLQPSGMALKLLSIVEKHGLEALS